MDEQPSPQTPPARPPGKPRTFACPSCGGPVTLRAVGQSISATCSQCSSLIDVADENLRIIEEANSALRQGAIPIGTRGKLKDIEWEVIGYMRRSDRSGDYRWTEYLLFNPYYGYRFLAEEQDHWTLVKMLNQDVPGAGRQGRVTANGRSYRFFGKGTALTTYVAGEFYWRASTADVTTATDYIAPPYRLMVESNGEEIIVSEGEYLDAGSVAAAFKVPLSRPSSWSAGVSQVNPHKTSLRVGLIAVAAATVLQFVSLAMAPGQRVNQQTYTLSAADKGKTLSSDTFALKSGGNVEIDSNAALDNDWLELDMTLVNTETNQSYPVSQALERYSGYDEDGFWSEGSNENSVLLPPVPAGTYKLLIEPDAGVFSKPAVAPSIGLSPSMQRLLKGGANMNTQDWLNAPPDPPPPPPVLPTQTVSIAVKRGVPVWSNYLIAVVLLAILPIFSVARRMMFEKSRWEKGGLAEEFEKGDS
ncbi:hypothetical protein GCM10007874_66270 [Labrys miyagiensis]|uniref:DUF4178 domain-containing protein n=1 Tax=Labrys miyagiensis TaxID=346912 RepID=A0ABQ6CTB1_9HYPH|nr:DUF4178 domain-containing protein [Labrys miyagiensis]GLS23606.1 hypothetical protein GCM10007874_66270 [Labrys miyagiensis]